MLLKKDFLISFYKNAIGDKSYLPVEDENGAIAFHDKINLLTRNESGWLYILALCDGDLMAADEIRAQLEHFKEVVLKMKQPAYFIGVFVFDGAPTEEKAAVLREVQTHVQVKNRYVKNLSISVGEQKWERHYTSPGGIFGFKKIIQTAFQAQGESFDGVEDLIQRKKEELTIPTKAKKPAITYGLIAVNVLIWIAMNVYSLKSGISTDALLTLWGSKDNSLIISGEYWRFFTAMFLHVNVVHIALNAWSLYAVGVLTERIFGHARFSVIYLLAGLCGNISSFAFSQNPSVGASGAIFGLMGALLYLGVEKPVMFRAYFGNSVMITVVMNLVYGFTANAGVDNFCHIGGLVGGFLFAGAVYTAQKRAFWKRIAYAGAGIALSVGVLVYAFNSGYNRDVALTNQMKNLEKSDQWVQAEKLGRDILSKNTSRQNIRISVLWEMCKAESVLGKDDAALVYANELQKLSPPDGHYMIGCIYIDMQKYSEAEQELRHAKALNAAYANIDELLNKISALKNGKK